MEAIQAQQIAIFRQWFDAPRQHDINMRDLLIWAIDNYYCDGIFAISIDRAS